MTPARMRRLASDYEEVKKNFAGHKNIIVTPVGEESCQNIIRLCGVFYGWIGDVVVVLVIVAELESESRPV